MCLIENLEVKCPIAILGAEIDNYAPPEVLKQLGEVLAEKSEARMVIHFRQLL